MLNSIEEAVEDIKAGKVVIVVDDEERENEGDFIAAAEKVSPEMINFMATHGRGLICASILEDRCDELDLKLMVGENTAVHETPFTVSVDLIGHGTTTGISASDRAKTIQALVDDNTKASDLGRPGHIFPLRAKQGGVLRRPGHTEATVDLARIAGLKAGGVLVEIMNEDGTMARLPELKKIAEKHELKIISIADLIAFRMKNESLIEREVEFDFETDLGKFHLVAFRQVTTDEEHIAITKGTWTEDEAVPVRVQSASLLTHIYENFRGKNGQFLHEVSKMMVEHGKGVALFMHQASAKGSLIDHLQNIKNNLDEETVKSDALYYKMDKQDYGVGAQILRNLGIRKMILVSNNPQNRTGLIGYGLEVVDNMKI